MIQETNLQLAQLLQKQEELFLTAVEKELIALVTEQVGITGANKRVKLTAVEKVNIFIKKKLNTAFMLMAK